MKVVSLHHIKNINDYEIGDVISGDLDNCGWIIIKGKKVIDLNDVVIYIKLLEGRVGLVDNSSLPVLNGRWFESLWVCCFRIVSLREKVELEPLDKSPLRAELSSVEILLIEGISVLKKYSISISLLHEAL